MNKYLFLIGLLTAMILVTCEKNHNSILKWDGSDTSVVVKKPNIYIYPQRSMELDIHIQFPSGGQVITSTPAYLSGWHISVEPNGTINESYRYLFYEAAVPNRWQQQKGWVVAKDSLACFFRQNMHSAGFIENEIEDFLSYWIPLMNDAYYVIYPQFSEEINPFIKLNFSEQPDHILRLFYLIRTTDPVYLPPEKPVVPRFKRSGFHVVEWGGIME